MINEQKQFDPGSELVGRSLYAHRFSFFIPGKVVSKANEKTGNRRLSEGMRIWETSVAWRALQAARKVSAPPAASGWVIIQCYCANKIHVDLSNAPKSILDALVKGRIFKDDKDVAVAVPHVIKSAVDKTEVIVFLGEK